MKKISYYLLSLLTIASFTACNEDFDDWALPQSNEQEDAKSVSFEVESTQTVFDLNTITTDSVDIAKQVSASVEEGGSIAYEILIDKDGTYSNKQKLPFMVKEGFFKVATADLNSVVEQFYGKRPEPRSLSLRINAFISTSNEQASLAEGSDLAITVTPVVLPIETEYYITGDVVGDWGPNFVLKFEHSGEDVYDDPSFTLLVKSPKENANFKIIPKSGLAEGADFWASALGTAVDGDKALEGTIVAKDPGAICIEKAGWTKITLNMLEYTYKIESLGDGLPKPETMYMIGSPWDWTWNNVGNSMTPINGMAGYFWAMQYFDADDEMKFCSVKDWKGDFGFSAANLSEATLAYANLSDAGGNIKVGKAGWYIVVVATDYADESQTAFKYTVQFVEPTVYLVGEASNGGWDNICTEQSDRFAVPATADGEFVSPAFVQNANELRLAINLVGFDWWKTEFIILDGKIAYRGNGGDQARVAVIAGQKAYLNFSNQTGSIK